MALFRHTVKSSAWKALSVGARAMFVALKTNYNSNSQNAVFMSARDGAEEFGIDKNTTGKWLHELEHYGFIVEVQGAHLGITGTGKAAHYRLTDCPYAGKPPTYDFQNWDGVLFVFKSRGGRKYQAKKQNPVCGKHTPRMPGRDIRANGQMSQNMEHRMPGRDIRNENECMPGRDITSLTSSLHLEAKGGAPHSAVAADERPDWATPTLTELFGRERDGLLNNLAKVPIEKSTKRKQTREEFDAEMAARGVDLSLSARRRCG